MKKIIIGVLAIAAAAVLVMTFTGVFGGDTNNSIIPGTTSSGTTTKPPR